MPGPAATLGSMHVCPMVTPGVPPVPHVGGPVTGPGVPTVLIGGKPAAVMGDMCTCVGPPDTIVMGQPNVLIGGKPAATMGSMTAHGGSITVGDPTVLIGTSAGVPAVVMPIRAIPFPKITKMDKILVSMSGKSLAEAEANQEKLKQLALKQEGSKDIGKLKRFDEDGSIAERLDGLGELKSKFLDDFADASDEAIEQIAKNPELVDSWQRVHNLGDEAFDELKKDPNFLKTFNDIDRNDELNKHALEGDVKIVGRNAVGGNIYKVTGIHSNKAFEDGTTRIKPGTQVEDLGDGFYKAKVEKQIDGFVNNQGTNWKVKTNKSTFFPDSWSKEKIQAEIANAFINKTPLGGNKYQGTTTTGHKVVMYLNDAGEINTAFPSL